MSARRGPLHGARPPIKSSLRLIATLLMVSGPFLLWSTMGVNASANSQPARLLQSPPQPVGTQTQVPVGSHRIGPLPGADSLTVEVLLRPRSATALAEFAAAVSTPRSPLYRHYLQTDQFASAFGPSVHHITAVEAALTAMGLHPGVLPANHLVIPITATANQLSQAFRVGISSYRLPGGRVIFAANRRPEFPGLIAPMVSGVVGLNDIVRPRSSAASGPSRPTKPVSPSLSLAGPASTTAPVFPSASRCLANVTGQFLHWSAYPPDLLASAYSLLPLYSQGMAGQGVRIGLPEITGFLPHDIATYQKCFGTHVSLTTQVVGGKPEAAPKNAEATFDIETLIGLAPKASIDVYEGNASNAGVLAMYNAMVSQNRDQVISISLGACEPQQSIGFVQAENTIFEEAAVQGQTVLAAAGDSGAQGCWSPKHPGLTGYAVSDPASQPFVTAVGGTALVISGRTKTITSETVWNQGTGCINVLVVRTCESQSHGATGGGGVSEYWPMPKWQSGVVSGASNSAACLRYVGGGPCREVPDVSASASPSHGYIVYWRGGWTHMGGTSAATPLWAAIIAVIDSSNRCQAGTLSRGAVGFLNPLLYGADSGPYIPFNDITTGNNHMPVSPGSKYQATTGYDMASGLGSPIAARLFPALCGDVVTVPATADIFAAGMSSPPNLAGGGGTLPPALTVNAVTSSMYMFSAAGLVNCGAGPWVGPQGAPCAGTQTTDISSYGGVSGIIDSASATFLVGVFTAGGVPAPPAPPRLNFSPNALGTNFLTLEPSVDQVFYIGAGATASNPQGVVVPTGATRLYLGIADAFDMSGTPGYYGDNLGSFEVRVTPVPRGITG